MSLALFGVLLLASTVSAGEIENPRFVSANGEKCVVVRQFPKIGDFNRTSWDEYWKDDPVDVWLEEVPLPDAPKAKEPEPQHGALYTIWPSGYCELLGEFTFDPEESTENILVADDGSFVTYRNVSYDADAEIITIRDADAKVVRTLRTTDVLTASDQQWLCRGEPSDVRYSISDDTLRMTILTTDTKWDDEDARHHTIDIDLATGDAPKPDRDHCPPALRVTAKTNDGRSQALLDRAVLRVTPEYPTVAMRARIAGKVIVRVTVDPDGNVASTSIIKPLPFGIDQAVAKAVPQWKFAPAPESATAEIEFTFEILRHIPIRTTTH